MGSYKPLQSVPGPAGGFPAVPLLCGALAYTFDGIVILSPLGCIKQVNHSACSILGQPIESLIGKSIEDFVAVRRTPVPLDIFAAPDDFSRHQTALTLKHFNDSVEVLVRECETNTPHERMWILREMSPNTAVLEALERQSRLLLEAQRVGRSGAWELDLTTGRLIWTSELRRLLEISAFDEEMTIERTFMFYTPASEAIVREAFHATATQGIPYDLELEVITAQGTRLWVREVCRATIRNGQTVSLIGVLQDITERRRLAEFMANAADQERRRVGADLHDGLGQELTGLALTLQALAARSVREGPSLTDDIRHLSQLASASVASVREIAHGMLPIALRHGDFKCVLQDLARSTQRLAGVKMMVRFRGEGSYFPVGKVAEQLYRIAQEAVTNAIKHGRATRINVTVFGSPSNSRLSVSDNGTGFDGKAAHGGMGLQIMRHRARSLGGLIDIRRGRSGGARVLCVVPPA